MNLQTIQDFANLYLMNHADELNKSPLAVQKTMQKFFEFARRTREDNGIRLDSAALEFLYRYSTAFAFTLAQHLSAFDRLSEEREWQEANSEVWARISSGISSCGSATTHLARPRAPLRAIRSSTGYILNGIIPFCTGFEIFDYVVIGFETEEEVFYAVCEFPNEVQSQGITIFRHELAVVNGTSSVKIIVEDLEVQESQIAGRRSKNRTHPAPPRASAYIGCEIGIAVEALDLVGKITANSPHPRNAQVENTRRLLFLELNQVRTHLQRDLANPANAAVIASLNQRAVRLLTIAEGAASIAAAATAARFNQELMLFDVVVQAPTTFEIKLRMLLGR